MPYMPWTHHHQPISLLSVKTAGQSVQEPVRTALTIVDSHLPHRPWTQQRPERHHHISTPADLHPASRCDHCRASGTSERRQVDLWWKQTLSWKTKDVYFEEVDLSWPHYCREHRTKQRQRAAQQVGKVTVSGDGDVGCSDTTDALIKLNLNHS